MSERCPECDNDDQELIGGLEVPDLRDGVLVWQCMVCREAWPAVTWGKVGRAAKRCAHQINEEMAAEEMLRGWNDGTG